jgi:LCP family protein required for cell wall assembly
VDGRAPRGRVRAAAGLPQGGHGAGRSQRGHPAAIRTPRGATRRPPARTAPAGPPPARSPRRARIAGVVASALVLALTGTAWGLYRDVTGGITTTDVIAGGNDDGAQDILLVGVDSRTDAKGNPLPQDVLRQLHATGDGQGVLNSDTIILLHVPEDGRAAVAFSVPRDAYVPIPGYRPDKINAAYPAVQTLTAERLVAEGVRDRARIDAESARAGRSALVGAVEQLTGVTVDHYAEVNLLGFANLTRAIGGVDVCLTAPTDDVLSGAHFPAGRRTVAGAEALAFVRQRHGLPAGDLSRIRRQQVFLAAVADKVLAAGTLTDPGKLRALVDVAQQSVVLDEGWDLLAFARQASGIAAGDLEFLTVPTRGTETNGRGNVVRVDPGEVRAFVEQRSAAREEAARRARDGDRAARRTPAPPPPLDVEAAHYVVHVRNGSGSTGLAGTVANRLVGLGFVRGTVDNTGDLPTSVVRHRDSGDAAEAVAAQLGGFAVEQDDTVPSGHLYVMLGADAPALIPGLTTPPPAPAPPAAAAAQPITAAGVPCVD